MAIWRFRIGWRAASFLEWSSALAAASSRVHTQNYHLDTSTGSSRDHSLVFQGNEARGENSHYAISDELYSNPATLEASTSIYAHGLFPDHGLQQADREQDYT